MLLSTGEPLPRCVGFRRFRSVEHGYLRKTQDRSQAPVARTGNDEAGRELSFVGFQKIWMQHREVGPQRCIAVQKDVFRSFLASTRQHPCKVGRQILVRVLRRVDEPAIGSNAAVDWAGQGVT